MTNNRKVIVSAPGKVILMGEHAVVYGRPAIAAAINKRVRVTVEMKNEKLRIKNDSEIPVGKHLGSSAAWAVARVGAVLARHTGEMNLELVNDLAYEMEKVHHGNPSGIDNTVSTYGGVVWFQKEQGMKRLKIDRRLSQSFWLVDTGQPEETTKEMVEYVRSRITNHESRITELLDENEDCTKKVAKALRSGDEKLLIEAIREGERTLEELGVVSSMAREIVKKVERDGGAAKILGGGGRKGPVGMMLVYHPDPKKLGLGLPMEQVQFEMEGVRTESINA